MGTDLLQIDRQGRKLCLDIGRDKKVAIEAVSQVMLDNHKWRLECRKCERVKAKRFNYDAHAHSSGDRGKSDTLQFQFGPRPQAPVSGLEPVYI